MQIIFHEVILTVYSDSTSPGKSSPSPTDTSSPPTPNVTAKTTSPQRPASTTGAFNGTAMNTMDARDADGSTNNFWIFFQHHSGQIRKSFTTQEGWSGGTNNDVVVSSDVKNGTPISASSFWAKSNFIDLTVSNSQYGRNYRRFVLTR